MLKIVFLIVAFLAFQSHASFVDKVLEETVYKPIEEAIIADGKSKEYAKCVVWVMKSTGATNDVTDLQNIFQPSQMAEKLIDKARFGTFICSEEGILILMFVSVMVLLLCCCCCCFYCCKPKSSVDMRYVHMAPKKNSTV